VNNPYGFPDFEISEGEAVVAQRLLDAIRRVEAKLDAMEHRQRPPGYAFMQRPETTFAGQNKYPPEGPTCNEHLEGK
jgi:hypothetical protein